MSRVPGLDRFNGLVGGLKREAQTMRETLNKLQDVHERKLKNNKAYRISKKAKHFENQLRDINNAVEAVEKLRPAGARWDIKFGELVLIDVESDERISQ
jgi:phage regulator Rha-like protein